MSKYLLKPLIHLKAKLIAIFLRWSFTKYVGFFLCLSEFCHRRTKF